MFAFATLAVLFRPLSIAAMPSRERHSLESVRRRALLSDVVSSEARDSGDGKSRPQPSAICGFSGSVSVIPPLDIEARTRLPL
jgi:hypothetical protein